jgi:hypothetical protein
VVVDYLNVSRKTKGGNKIKTRLDTAVAVSRKAGACERRASGRYSIFLKKQLSLSLFYYYLDIPSKELCSLSLSPFSSLPSFRLEHDKELNLSI